MVAVPAWGTYLTSSTAPRRWMSVQCGAKASQKFTSPGATGVPEAATVAASVIAVPLTTVITGVPSEVTASVVAVATGAGCADATEAAMHRINAETGTKPFNGSFGSSIAPVPLLA